MSDSVGSINTKTARLPLMQPTGDSDDDDGDGDG